MFCKEEKNSLFKKKMAIPTPTSTLSNVETRLQIKSTVQKKIVVPFICHMAP